MLRIEILFDKESKQKPTAAVMDALKTEIERRLKPQFSDMVTRIALSSSQTMTISGVKAAEDKEKVQEVLESIWLDDGWLPEVENDE